MAEGVGTQLAEAAVSLAVKLGRPTIKMSAALPATIDPLEPDLPSTKIATRFGLARVAVDIARAAPLPLPAAVEEASARCLAGRSSGYRLVSWRDATPEARVDDMIELLEQFAADQPTDDKGIEPARWSRERLRHAEQWALDAGRTSLVVAAIGADDQLVGFTQVQRSRTVGSTIAWQNDTIVLPEHRGSGLGLRMKLVTHRNLGENGGRSVVTWTAQANPPMTAINALLGYRIVSREVGYRN